MARTGRPRTFTESTAIDAATDVFWERGYSATTMQQIGERAGVLPGSLHAAFGDKHSLFLLALEQYTQGQREFGRALHQPGPVLPRLRETLYRIAETPQPRGCMLGNTATELATTDPTAATVVRTSFAELETAIERALERAQRADEIAPGIDCATQARLLIALMQGLHVLARVERQPQRLRDVIDAALAPLQYHSRP
jgi:TetR/AcrR family transcriptional regulator, transcriptional repressor for nem operon